MAAIKPLKRYNEGASQFGTGDFLPVENGGTGAITAAAARTALGLAIGTNVQAYSAILADLAGVTGAKGDLFVYDSVAGSFTNLGVGTDGQVPTANSALDAGIEWATPVSSPVATFDANNGNAGAITLGQPVYIKSDGDVDLCLADDWATCKFVGVVQDASVATSASATIQMDGTIDFGSTGAVDALAGTTGGFTPGAIYAVDPNTAGNYIAAASVVDAGDVVVPALLAVSAQVAKIIVDGSRILLS